MPAAAVGAVIVVEKLSHRRGILGSRAVRGPPPNNAWPDHIPAHQQPVSKVTWLVKSYSRNLQSWRVLVAAWGTGGTDG